MAADLAGQLWKLGGAREAVAVSHVACGPIGDGDVPSSSAGDGMNQCGV